MCIRDRYVPQDRILNATIAAAKLNMRVVISIETREKTNVTREKFINDPRYQAEIENTELKKFVSILSAIWVSYHKDTVFEYSENSEDYVEYKGCDSLFESICLTPNRTIVGCCGLSVEHIDVYKRQVCYPALTVIRKLYIFLIKARLSFGQFLGLPKHLKKKWKGRTKNLNL